MIHLEIKFLRNWNNTIEIKLLRNRNNTMSRFYGNLFQSQALKSLPNIQLYKLIVTNTAVAIMLFIIFMEIQSADTRKYFQLRIHSCFLSLIFTDKCWL